MRDVARKILDLFEPSEHWRLAGLLGAMVVTGLFQTVGIASIMPFLAIVSNPAAIEENEYLAWGFQTLEFSSGNAYLIALGILFIVLMVLANGFNTLTAWLVLRFQWRTHERLSHRLLDVYLHASFAYHLNQNSARLGASLLNQVTQVTRGLIIPASTILSRGISSLFIVALLVAVDPLLAGVVSLTIGGFYTGVYVLVRKKQGELGATVLQANTERYQVANEAFGGIKEMKVLGRKGHFLSRFLKPSIRYAHANKANAFVGLLPRFVLETFAYGGIVVVILYLLQTRESLDQIFPLLAVYAFGANQLIPGVQEIFNAMTVMRLQMATVDELHADVTGRTMEGVLSTRSVRASDRSLTTEKLALHEGESIRVEGLWFRYPFAKQDALKGIDLDLPINRTSALVGATGSGKTTLVDLLLGLFEPTEGRILAGDRVLDDDLLPAWQNTVGYVPQSNFLCDASIAENIAFGIPPDRVDSAAVVRAARAAHLHAFVSTLDEGYETVVGERGIRLWTSV
ncbi:MAG: ABC transporter ATP-binding protein [Gemmatimonadota bacterium]